MTMFFESHHCTHFSPHMFLSPVPWGPTVLTSVSLPTLALRSPMMMLTSLARQYKSKIRDTVQRGNITINEVSFARAPEMTYSMVQTEQLLGNLELDESNWLDMFPCQVTVDEVHQGHIIKCKLMVNNVPVNTLHDTGMSMSCMAKWFFDTLPMKTKLIPCNRYIAGVGGETLRPVGECFIHLQIGRRVFQDRVVVIKNLRHKYILGQILHRSYWFGTGFSTMGKTLHYH